VLRWAGGKRRLIESLLALLPSSYERLIEPFAGSAALFFACRPTKAVLGDSNPELINFYEVLADHTDALVEGLLSLKASRPKYYEFRRAKPRSQVSRAVRFAYLNRLCWNGLYRVNRQGAFNVPIGDRLPNHLWTRQQLEMAAKALKSAALVCSDFEQTLAKCASGDLVYLDPPYPKGSRTGSGFNRYTAAPFTAADHERLARRAASLHEEGVRVVVSLAALDPLVSLYAKAFSILCVGSSSLISCNGHTRGRAKEMILKNYD
jgi:DNA adenine methylase